MFMTRKAALSLYIKALASITGHALLAQTALLHDFCFVAIGCKHRKCWPRSWWQTSAAQR